MTRSKKALLLTTSSALRGRTAGVMGIIVPFLMLEGECSRAYDKLMLDWADCPAVERVPGKVSGAWVFKGTRVPVVALFENLEAGASVDDFLEWFPGVGRDQVEDVLQHADRSLVATKSEPG